MINPIINLFYSEPDPDRWFPCDRYVRRVIRRFVRGRPRVGGQKRVFLNLIRGLDLLNVPYRVNDYRFAKKNPASLLCILGKPHVYERCSLPNPIVFGPCLYSHPLGAPPSFLRDSRVKKILVPGNWMAEMCRPAWGDRVVAWPVGIDTDMWRPAPQRAQLNHKAKILLYNKILWEKQSFEASLVRPIKSILASKELDVEEIKYGFYEEADFKSALDRCSAMIFLCEHETQGIAYQQALSCGVPILAWDRGGYWQDPEFFPERVRYEPVSSVPYWSERCGIRFSNLVAFEHALSDFLYKQQQGFFDSRSFVLENLSLEKCASAFYGIVNGVMQGLG